MTYSDGSKEVLACVHKHYFKRDADGSCYHDPHTTVPEQFRSPKFVKQIDLIRSKGRVILTTDDVNEGGEPYPFKRSGYVAVYPISDFVVDDEGMRFRFGTPIRPR